MWIGEGDDPRVPGDLQLLAEERLQLERVDPLQPPDQFWDHRR